MTHTDASEEDKTAQVQQIAAAMPKGWTWETDRAFRILRHADGYAIVLDWPTCWHGAPSRIDVRGWWPCDTKGKRYTPYEGAPHITVTASKDAKKIAGDIVRRFLPEYFPLWGKTLERAEQMNLYYEQTAQSTAALVAAGCRTSEHTSQVYAHDSLYTLTVQGESVRFEAFSCQVPTAIALLHLLDEKQGPARVATLLPVLHAT